MRFMTGMRSHARAYMAAIALFEFGSLFCSIAPSVNVLIFGRVLAGVGAAGICVSVLTIIAEVLFSTPLALSMWS